MNALPRPDIRYRIQSDDFDTFLELYDAKDSSIVPRLAQRDSLLQQAGAHFLPSRSSDYSELQWIFVPSGTGYNILNAATKSLPLPRYLTLPPMSSHLGAGQAEAITKPVKAWNVKMVEGGTFRCVESLTLFCSILLLSHLLLVFHFPFQDWKSVKFFSS